MEYFRYMVVGHKNWNLIWPINDGKAKVDCYQMNDARLDLALVRHKYDVIIVLLDGITRIEDELKHNIFDLHNFLDMVENAKRLLWATKVIVVHYGVRYQNVLTDMLNVKQRYLPDFTIFDIQLEPHAEKDENWKIIKDSIIAGRSVKTICHTQKDTDDKVESVGNAQMQEQAQEQEQMQEQEQEQGQEQGQVRVVEQELEPALEEIVTIA